MKKVILIVLCILLCGCQKDLDTKIDTGVDKEVPMEKNELKISLTIRNETLMATLEDNETAKKFAEQLPISISMSELNGNEKYYYFNTSFPNHPTQVNRINSGDLMLFGSDCFVLFYDDFDTNYSYTRIGTIDHPDRIKEIVGTGDVEVFISKE